MKLFRLRASSYVFLRSVLCSFFFLSILTGIPLFGEAHGDGGSSRGDENVRRVLRGAVSSLSRELDEEQVVAIGALTYSNTGIGSEFSAYIGDALREAFRDIGTAHSRVMTRGLAVKAKDELRDEDMISYTIVE